MTVEGLSLHGESKVDGSVVNVVVLGIGADIGLVVATVDVSEELVANFLRLFKVDLLRRPVKEARGHDRVHGDGLLSLMSHVQIHGQVHGQSVEVQLVGFLLIDFGRVFGNVLFHVDGLAELYEDLSELVLVKSSEFAHYINQGGARVKDSLEVLLRQIASVEDPIVIDADRHDFDVLLHFLAVVSCLY